MVMMQAESPLDQAMLPPRNYNDYDDSNKSNDDFKFWKHLGKSFLVKSLKILNN